MQPIAPFSSARRRAAPVRSAPARPAAAPTAARARTAPSPAADGPGWLARLNGFALWLLLGVPADGPARVVTLASPSARYVMPAERAAAAATVAAGAAAERASLATLGARAPGYTAIADALADKPLGRAALQAFLRDGRLTAARDLRGHKDLLAHLATIAQGPLAAGLDRSTLLDHLLQELAEPVKIAQGSKSTCAATAALMVAAARQPAELARLVAGLAAPGGGVTLATGESLTREADWALVDDGGRTLSQRLLQPALMEFGNGLQAYDNTADTNHLGPLPLGLAGLSAGGTRRVTEALTGERFKAVTLYRWNRAGALDALRAAVAAGKQVPIAMTWEAGLHQLVVVAIHGDHVELLNPGGARERLPWQEFAPRVQRALLPR